MTEDEVNKMIDSESPEIFNRLIRFICLKSMSLVTYSNELMITIEVTVKREKKEQSFEYNFRIGLIYII